MAAERAVLSVPSSLRPKGFDLLTPKGDGGTLIPKVAPKVGALADGVSMEAPNPEVMDMPIIGEADAMLAALVLRRFSSSGSAAVLRRKPCAPALWMFSASKNFLSGGPPGRSELRRTWEAPMLVNTGGGIGARVVVAIAARPPP